MQKRLKFTLYIILILIIIAVIRLMFGKTNTQSPTDTNIEISTGEDITDNNNGNTINIEIQDNTFEDDVMNDLEGFFNDNNGYEDIQGEFGFTNPGNE